ncbi:uncharacterized protein LOC108683205 [Hyalella azteca]|uniref:Uncharacterized protein LOC108683205 n=1 Tax=Hyalella azteca TaxID=294128 RepID=A0A8B7PP61_HYAAZ|nr:uncharacterized protein LOC108683205 [Hyalella azteca]
MRVAILLTVLAVGCQSSQPIAHAPITGRKIGGSPSDWGNQAFLPGYHVAYSGYGNGKLTPKIERHDEVVIEDGDTVIAEPQQPVEEEKIENSTEISKVVVGTSNKKTLSTANKGDGKPNRTAMQKRRRTINVIFDHLFEIIQDVFKIASKLNQQAYAQRKENSIAAEDLDAWPMLKGVFLKYIKMLRETELMDSLGHIIPVYELEGALEQGDPHHLLRVITESVTPKMLGFVFDSVRDFVLYLTHVGERLDRAELREYIPSGIDIMWPFRVLVQQTLALVGALVPRNEMGKYWEEFRSYSPLAARSLEYVLPLEDNTSNTNTFETNAVGEKSMSEATFTERALEHPVALVAGVGSAVAAAFYVYRSIVPEEVVSNSIRKKRSADDDSSIPEIRMNSAEVQKIVEAVEQEPSFNPDVPAFKPKKVGGKKYIRP